VTTIRRIRSTAGLVQWAGLSQQNWSTLLTGNGASINIWKDFAYPQLKAKAQLDPAAIQLFQDLGTTDFEAVLESLWHAERVMAALSRSPRQVTELYESVQRELAAAVRAVHVPWVDVPASTFTTIANEINSHNLVFSLNYDLVSYWALMQNRNAVNTGDYFWTGTSTFNPTDTALQSGRTGVLYLHGGLHLWTNTSTGETGKWSSWGGSLLSNLLANLLAHPNRQPLFVSEGTSRQKMRAIRNSDYLTFARQQLIDDDADTVIFGANFAAQDSHIVEAINAGARRQIAVSVHPGTRAENVATMARYRQLFPLQHLVFFDSRTHPLGDPALHIS
jgi:hypothetical protein